MTYTNLICGRLVFKAAKIKGVKWEELCRLMHVPLKWTHAKVPTAVEEVLAGRLGVPNARVLMCGSTDPFQCALVPAKKEP
jgi:hypothetical protein